MRVFLLYQLSYRSVMERVGIEPTTRGFNAINVAELIHCNESYRI
jgi:glutaminase